MEKGVKKNLPVFVYVCTICVYLFMSLFIYFMLTAVVS